MTIQEYIAAHKSRFMEEWASLIRIPSVSCQEEHKPDMLRCAERWKELLLAAGCQKAEVLPSQGNPFVYAEYKMTNDKSQITNINAGALIDTPGIKGFGTIDFEKEEVSHYFREIFRVGRECRFSNCTHTNEPGCAVQEAVIKGSIAISRYESYLSILNDATEGKYRG